MDRDDAGTSDRGDEARHGDTGMIGSESEDPGPGRDTSLTDPDPVAASTDQPRGTVGMSEGDPMRTRLGSHVEGAGVIGYDVAASEEGAATQETPAEDRPGYEPERPAGETTAAWAGPTAADAGVAEPVVDQGAYARDAGLTGTPAVDQASYERDAGVAPVQDPAGYGAGDAMADASGSGAAGVAGAGYEGEPGGAGMAGYQDEPGSDAPATYRGEEADVTGWPDDAPERLDRPGPQEPGVQEGIYDQEADQAREQRPSDGV